MEMRGEMEVLETTFSAQPSLKAKKKTTNVNLTTSRTYSSQSSFSGNADCEATSGHSVAKNLENTPLDYHGDVISCIIEGSGPDRRVGECVHEADKKTLSCSSASVDSSFPVMDIQSADKFRGNEALELAEELPDRSDEPSEASSYRKEQPGLVPMKREHAHFSIEEDAPLSGPVKCATDGQKIDLHTSAHSVETSMEKNDGNQLEADTLKSSKRSEHSEFIQALDVSRKVDHCLLSQAEGDDSSEELVDVRVCDICGDVGREELLAVCSRCGDGAEHIYCMRVKLDKPPEGDWMCEDCVTSEQQTESGAVGKSAGLKKISPFRKEQPGSGEMVDSGYRKQPSTKRFSSNLQASSVKRRFFHRSLSSIMTKRDLQEAATLKKFNKGECLPLSTPVPKKSGEEGRKSSHLPNKFLPDGRQSSGLPSLKRNYSMYVNTSSPTSPRSSLGTATIEGKKRRALLGNATFKREIMPKASANEKKIAGFETRKVPDSAGSIDHKASVAGASRHLMPSPGRENRPVDIISSSGVGVKQSFKDIPTAAGSHLKKADNIRLETTQPVERMRPSGVIPSSVYPEPDHIWRGVFKFEKGGKVPACCNGIQAHLSSCASPKVPEVMLKFPLEIHLSEVPRQDAWPILLQKNGASDDHIALYFFAEDHYSYHRTYAGLLECMIVNDLALVADLGGIELLIFPSSVLPQRCQRWNNLSYLWGVFRGTKARSQCSSPVTSPNKTNIPNLNGKATVQEYSSSLNPFIGGIVSQDHALHQPVKVADLGSQNIVASASTSHEHGGSEAQELAFLAKVGGSPTTAAEVLLPNNSVKQVQIFRNMRPSENLQKEDECRLRPHTDRDLLCGTSLLDVSNVGECSQNSSLSTNFMSRCGRDDLHGTFDPMIDSSSIERTNGAHGSMISFIPLLSDPSPPDSTNPYISGEGQTDPMDLELSLGSMTKPLKRGNLIPFLAASKGEDFRFRQHDVDVNLSLR